MPYQHQYTAQHLPLKGHSNTQIELHTDINIPRHLHDLGEIDRLLRRLLEVLDREDLQSGVVDLVMSA
jgi:hypothetical protein